MRQALSRWFPSRSHQAASSVGCFPSKTFSVMQSTTTMSALLDKSSPKVCIDQIVTERQFLSQPDRMF
jgi:hypothetical protein